MSSPTIWPNSLEVIHFTSSVASVGCFDLAETPKLPSAHPAVVAAEPLGEPGAGGTWKTPIFMAGLAFCRTDRSKLPPGIIAAFSAEKRVCASVWATPVTFLGMYFSRSPTTLTDATQAGSVKDFLPESTSLWNSLPPTAIGVTPAPISLSLAAMNSAHVVGALRPSLSNRPWL